MYESFVGIHVGRTSEFLNQNVVKQYVTRKYDFIYFSNRRNLGEKRATNKNRADLNKVQIPYYMISVP